MTTSTGGAPMEKKSMNLPDEILPYSPVNVVGKIISEEDILYQIKDGNKVVIKSE